MALHPQAEFLIEAVALAQLPPLDELSPEDARLHYNLRSAELPANPAIGEVSDRKIPGPDGDIGIRVYQPVKANADEDSAGELRPALIFFHGGGWVIGTIDTHDVVCRALCEALEAVVVSVDYRLAPEHPFPAAADDCTAATKWVAEHGEEIGVDGTRLALCGDSAGGNLAAVVSQDCAAVGPKVSAQALIYPCVNATREKSGSLIDNADGYLLTTNAMDWFYDQYVPDADERDNPRCSPFLGDLTGQPPAIVITAEYDPLLDEGEEYADKLREAGVPVEYIRVDGQVHTFFTQVGVCDASAESVARVAAFVKEHW